MGRKLASSEYLDKLKQLVICKENQWSRLPGWAGFFLELGASLSNFHDEKVKYVTALALPTRSFAANLIGSGFSYTSAFLHPDEDENHLQRILTLPNGTPVKYLDKGKIKNAIKSGTVTSDNKLLIGLIIEAEGNKTIYVESSKANRIEITDKEIKTLPFHQKGRDIRPPSELMQALLQGYAYEYVFRTRVDGIIVGSSAALEEEAQSVLGIQSDNGKIYQGFLFELFRVKGFNPSSTGHRFLMHSTNVQEPITIPPQIASHSAVIFDGPLGFLKWKDFYKMQNWIVVLDHTASNFDNAVNQLNQECSFRSQTKIILPTPPIPSGIEMMIFGRDI